MTRIPLTYWHWPQFDNTYTFFSSHFYSFINANAIRIFRLFVSYWRCVEIFRHVQYFLVGTFAFDFIYFHFRVYFVTFLSSRFDCTSRLRLFTQIFKHEAIERSQLISDFATVLIIKKRSIKHGERNTWNQFCWAEMSKRERCFVLLSVPVGQGHFR